MQRFLDFNAQPEPTNKVLEVNFTQSVNTLEGVSICHVMGKPRGGVTMAYRKANDFKNCRMVEVAVAYCSPADIFSKKVGTANARSNFLDGRTIMVPARDPAAGDESIPVILKAMFTLESEYLDQLDLA